MDPATQALIKKYPSLARAMVDDRESHDGREQELRTYITSHPDFSSLKNNPAALLKAVDEFSASNSFLISVGGHKAEVLTNIVLEEKPKVILELGGYLGYSAIVFADAMRKANGGSNAGLKIWSFEMDPLCALIAQELVELSGLGEIVTFVVGSAEEELRNLNKESKVTSFDLLFLDHSEELYETDLKVCEELGLLKKGAVIVADNVVRPGAPKYREYVRGHAGLSSVGVRGLIQPGDFEDEFEVSHVLN